MKTVQDLRKGTKFTFKDSSGLNGVWVKQTYNGESVIVSLSTGGIYPAYGNSFLHQCDRISVVVATSPSEG